MSSLLKKKQADRKKTGPVSAHSLSRCLGKRMPQFKSKICSKYMNASVLNLLLLYIQQKLHMPSYCRQGQIQKQTLLFKEQQNRTTVVHDKLKIHTTEGSASIVNIDWSQLVHLHTVEELSLRVLTLHCIHCWIKHLIPAPHTNQSPMMMRMTQVMMTQPKISGHLEKSLNCWNGLNNPSLLNITAAALWGSIFSVFSSFSDV